jgi:23S rRNA (uracil1939-C5)-methyltransferase
MSQNITATVQSLSFKGLGICRYNDKVYFIDGCWPGDEIEFSVTKEKKSYGFGELKKIITSSKERRTQIPCSYHGYSEENCGGCSWMMATDESQIKWKEKIFKDLASKNNIEIPEEFSVITPEKKIGYKSRAQFYYYGDKLGFHAKGTQKIVDIKNCKILTEKMNEKLADLREAHHPAENNKIYVDHRHHSYDQNIFSQSHEEINKWIKQWLKEEIKEIAKDKKVLELFSGQGNFTHVLTDHFKNVTCIDYKMPKEIPFAKNISLNLFERKELLSYKSQLEKNDILLIDPPRKGCIHLDFFLENNPFASSFFYVSCNPTSFLEDAKVLLKFGYKLTKLNLLDAYPQTPHLEIAARFHLIIDKE